MNRLGKMRGIETETEKCMPGELFCCLVIGACIAMYLHVLYCRHQKYRDVGKPFFKGLFFSSQNSLPGFDLPFDVSMPEFWCYLLLHIRVPVQPIYLGLCIIANGHFIGAHFCVVLCCRELYEQWCYCSWYIYLTRYWLTLNFNFNTVGLNSWRASKLKVGELCN